MKKMKNIWNAIQWPLLLVIFEFCILFLLLGYYEHREVQLQLDAHPKWTMTDLLEFISLPVIWRYFLMGELSHILLTQKNIIKNILH